MTSPNDLIFGGAGGTATRFVAPVANQVLTSNGGGALTWAPQTNFMINPLTTTGDIIFGTGTVPTRLAGAAGFLKSTGAAAPTWSSVNLATADVSGILTTAKGGTGLNTSTAANGQLLIGNGGGLTVATLTSGTNINIVNGAGSITINSTAMANPLTTNGDIIYAVGTAPTRLAAGVGFLKGGAVPAYGLIGAVPTA